MKKKLTKLTKMFLVLCLVVSELSSVGLVFAEDVSTKFDSNINPAAEGTATTATRRESASSR